MKRGIYTIANDDTLDRLIAMLNSIRFYDKETPICIIPYNSKIEKVRLISTKYTGVKIWEDDYFLKELERKIQNIFGKEVFHRTNQFRKQACWFGPFDQFLYLDADIVVFEKIADNLKYLEASDFICCDYQYVNGVEFLFTQKVLTEGAISQKETKKVFNAGFWGSKKGTITENILWETFGECAKHMEYFDFSQKVSDMPIINYLVLTKIDKTFNIARDTGEKGAGTWAGCDHFIKEGNKLIDPTINKTLKYLHWAGIKIQPGCPYCGVWMYYHNLMGCGVFWGIPRWVFVSILDNCRSLTHQIRSGS